MRARTAAAAGVAATIAGTAHAAADIDRGAAVLRALDKVTARVSVIVAPVNMPVRFQNLEITARACRQTPPTEPPESAAFLSIRELPPKDEPVDLFSGWMFASSPGLSALEHPVYDVWVIDCDDS